MIKFSIRWKIGFKILKFLVVFICLGGFLFQTFEFLFLYWTYPTVVDIQKVSPSTLEIPAFTICNPIGYNYPEMCQFSNACVIPDTNCTKTELMSDTCEISNLAPDYELIDYARLMQEHSILPQDHDFLRQRLEEYMVCTIEYAGQTKFCNMENVMGTFYSEDDLPHYCYTIYSLWGKPDKEKERETIQNSAKMRFHFTLNASRREHDDDKEWPLPRFNVPSSPQVQIAVHSPYFLPSPYLKGDSYMGGKSYEMRITMRENILLPSPYQTNCTDYKKIWKERGGEAPIDQLGVIQECRLNMTYKALGCIPITLDYPHNYPICQSCELHCKYNVSTDECTKLADDYNEPCDSVVYTTTKETKMITIYENVAAKPNRSRLDDGRIRIMGHDCEGLSSWKKECSVIDIEVLFDRFLVTKYIYNAKFESLELFSVIGGYLGMWLGVSLLAVYDFLETLFDVIKARYETRKKNGVQLIQRKKPPRKRPSRQTKNSLAVTTEYNWQ